MEKNQEHFLNLLRFCFLAIIVSLAQINSQKFYQKKSKADLSNIQAKIFGNKHYWKFELLLREPWRWPRHPDNHFKPQLLRTALIHTDFISAVVTNGALSSHVNLLTILEIACSLSMSPCLCIWSPLPSMLFIVQASRSNPAQMLLLRMTFPASATCVRSPTLVLLYLKHTHRFYSLLQSIVGDCSLTFLSHWSMSFWRGGEGKRYLDFSRPWCIAQCLLINSWSKIFAK